MARIITCSACYAKEKGKKPRTPHTCEKADLSNQESEHIIGQGDINHPSKRIMSKGINLGDYGKYARHVKPEEESN